jgi:TetR/AcrR family transcriptional regulator
MREDKLGAIHRAAAKLFAERGFERTSVDEIAAQAGVAKGTIFYHFKSKDDLFRQMLDRGMAHLTQSVRAVLEANPDPVEALCAVIRIQTTLIHDNPEFFRIALAELWGDQDRQQELRQSVTIYLRQLQAIAAAGMAAGQIKAVTPETVADVIFGMTSVAAFHLLLAPVKRPVATVVEELQGILRAGILA